MPQYRKKPVVIEAVQWTGENQGEVMRFTGDKAVYRSRTGGSELVVHTLEGVLVADPGDWIIRGVKGEFYPCKPDIFAATYEPAEEAA
jgi:hypothetical protein